MNEINNHFSEIAEKYRDLRTTDSKPILYIKKQLERLPQIEAADIGCGAGRYDLLLLQQLSNITHMYCVDGNKEMLGELKEYLNRNRVTNVQPTTALAQGLPIKSGSLDCLFTFNAIHHFDITEFLEESARVLKNRGYLFIYTRFRS